MTLAVPAHGRSALVAGGAVPAPAPGRQLARLVLVSLAAVSMAVVVEAVVVSGLQHKAAQTRAFAQFRSDLALGTVPVGQHDQEGKVLALGTPIALLEVPAAHVREVVGEGTTPSALVTGPGHSRATPFPGQAGVSVVMGRRAAFGGPFRGLPSLNVGATIKVTTGQGISRYRVTGVRRAGEPIPPLPPAGEGRLVLVTADGWPFAPSGAVYVDAELTSDVFPAPARSGGPVPAPERPLGNDWSAVVPLVFWLQLFLLATLGSIWSWVRWGHAQTWVVFLPVLALVTIGATGQFLRLLPNLT